MRATTDLLNLQFAFSQQKPLTLSEFIKALEQRFASRKPPFFYWEQLEELHRVGALVPMFRFQKNTRFLLNQARKNRLLAMSAGLGKDVGFEKTSYGQEFGFLLDVSLESFRPWYDFIKPYKTDYFYQGKTGKEEIGYFWSSSFLYSPYQLLLAPQLLELLSNIRIYETRRNYSSSRLRFRILLDKKQQAKISKEAEENRDLIIALTAVEAKYFPQLRGHRFSAVYSGSAPFIDEIIEYQKSFDPTVILDWIGWDAGKVKDIAEKLLWQADRLDPLEDWHELIRMCHPDMLNRLRGDALIALDHRRAAEMLLIFYEDLQTYNAAPELLDMPKRVRGPHDTRLKYDLAKLDEILMKFGLSPQPALVLVIEGETEEYIVPEVMKLLEIPQYSSFIQIFNIKGVDKDFELLARYVAPPQLGHELENGVLLTRPATHFLVAVDAESKFKDSEKRKDILKTWVDGILKAIPEQYRTENMQADLDYFINVETWNEDVFEFAHFTNEELALALYETHKGSEHPTLEDLIDEVSKIRQRENNRNIEDVLRKWNYQKEQENPNYVKGREVGKTDLAQALWPLLKSKIKELYSSGDDPNQIPIVRIILKAEQLAHLNHRKDVMIRR